MMKRTTRQKILFGGCRMVIVMYMLIVRYAIPVAEKCMNTFFTAIGPVIIVLAGIVMVFGAVGFTIAKNLGSTIVGGIFRATAYLVRQVARGVALLIVNVVKLVPMVFVGTRRAMMKRTKKSIVSTGVAVLATIATIAVVI